MELKLGRSKSGLPVLYEQGGGMTNTGEAYIVCGPNGECLSPMWSTQNGYIDSPHAVFAAKVGQIVIHADRLRDHIAYTFYRVESVEGEGQFKEIAYYGVGEWSGEEKHRFCVNEFDAAFNAAATKVKCYHCREAHYAANRQAPVAEKSLESFGSPRTPLEVAVNALKVITLDPKISTWLKQNDPKALEQAEKAIQAAEGARE